MGRKRRDESAPTPRVTAIGAAAVDEWYAVSNIPEPDGGAFAHDVTAAPGGVGANVAVALDRLGRDVGLVSRVGDDEYGRQLMALFPGLRLMAERPLTQNDRQHLHWLEQLSVRLGCAVVATGNVLMHRRRRKPLQDLVTAIRLGRPLPEAADHLQSNAEAYLRPRERLARLFPPAWIRETLNLVRECRFGLDELRYEYPGELVPEGHTPTTWLRELVEQGRHWRFPDGVPDTIDRQLSHELELIESLAYEPFFLTIHDIVRFARERGILCQGRGSAANSVVCYCLGIT